MMFILLCTEDPECFFGRISHHDLPQQSLMEILIDGIPDGQRITTGPRRKPENCCTWTGVLCDSEKNVTRITWMFLFFARGGMMDFRYLPETLEEIIMPGNCMKGSLPLVDVPENLHYMSLSRNLFEGTIDLGDLPKPITDFLVDENNLSGKIELTSLPEALKNLHLQRNAFDGTLCLTQLPKNLVELFLYENSFSGSVVLKDLPPSLEELCASKNRLSGDIDLLGVSNESTALVDFSENQLNGSLRMQRDGRLRINVKNNLISRVVDENGDSCFSMRLLSIGWNE